jgi:uncharacterized membrane protein
MRVASLGQALFAAAMIGLGILGLVHGDFTPIWSGVPKAMPGREIVAYLCAVVSLVCGLGLLWPRSAVFASGALLGYFFIWMLLFRVPLVFRAPKSAGVWWVCGETAVLAAAPWALYATLAADRDGPRRGFASGENGLRIARALYGLGLISFGVGHFTFFQRTVGMVPGWLPWPVAWACFTGGAFIAAGAALFFNVLARLAAVLTVAQLVLLTLLVWAPVVAAHPSASDWDEFVSSCTLTAVAWAVADSFRDSRRSAVAGATEVE